MCLTLAFYITSTTFGAIPPKFKGVGTFPVRAMAKLIKPN
jgi:kynurenine formamidase